MPLGRWATLTRPKKVAAIVGLGLVALTILGGLLAHPKTKGTATSLPTLSATIPRSESSAKPTASQTKPSHRRRRRKPQAAARSAGLTGFGAANAAWDANHQADGRFASGAAYNQDPSLSRPGNGDNNDRYFAVLHAGGRVFQYEMRFPPGTTVAQARQSVLQSEFARGARMTDFRRFSSCAVMTVHDPRLSGVAPHGDVGVEFGSGINDISYDPSDVWTAILTAPPPTQC